MEFLKKNLIYLEICLLALGILLRIFVATRGENYDMQSMRMVVSTIARGGNVYEEVTRYNYAPGYFLLLGLLNAVSSIFPDPAVAFRLIVSGFLTIADVCLFLIIKKYWGRFPAFLFFLNPISIILTGYHSQFENLVILIALLGILFFQDSKKEGWSNDKLIGLVLIGISLTVKHVFFAFPLWLAIREKKLKSQILILFIPTFIFFISFLPYLGSVDAIVTRVFDYKGFDNSPLWNLILPNFLKGLLSKNLFFLIGLFIGAFVARKKRVLDSFLLYTVFLILFLPSVANQNFTIPLLFISVYPNILFLAFTLAFTFHLLIGIDGLHIPLTDFPDYFTPITSFLAPLVTPCGWATGNCWSTPIILLSLGYLWMTFGDHIKKGLASFRLDKKTA